MQHFDTALNADPKSVGEVCEGKASMYQSLAKPELALKCYDAALESPPGVAYLHKRRGECLQQQHKENEASKEFEIAAKLSLSSH